MHLKVPLVNKKTIPIGLLKSDGQYHHKEKTLKGILLPKLINLLDTIHPDGAP